MNSFTFRHIWLIIGIICFAFLAVVTLQKCDFRPFLEHVPHGHESHSNVSLSKSIFSGRLEHLASSVSDEKMLLLFVIDGALVDMALNVYISSLRPFGITNFLFAGLSQVVCDVLKEEKLPCVVYINEWEKSKASSYLSHDFIRKANNKARVVAHALDAGFTIILSDIDVSFLQNPMPWLRKVPQDVDLAALWDNSVFNSGFFLVRPTDPGKAIIKRMNELTSTHTNLHDQKVLNMAIRERHSLRGNVIKLDTKQFLCGKAYFEDTRRMFAFENPCTECIVVHNNWIVSKAAKIYRLKEHLLWQWDGQNRYYSDPTRKYIIYDNPPSRHFKDAKQVSKMEETALVNALAIGMILNRTVILSPFHCSKNLSMSCGLNSRYRISAFDAHFGGAYRENTFLHNPLVPDNTRKSVSPTFMIQTRGTNETLTDHKDLVVAADVKRLTPFLSQAGPSISEVVEWFGGINDSILHFHSLYSGMGSFDSLTKQATFTQKMKGAFIVSDYRQLKNYSNKQG